MRKMKREIHQISDEQWALFLNMLKICHNIKLSAQRCNIAPVTAYRKGYYDVAFFQEVTKIMNGDYEATTLPALTTIAKEL
jgi:hypothetical protein